MNNRYLKGNQYSLQWLLDNPPEDEDPYSPQATVSVAACTGGLGLFSSWMVPNSQTCCTCSPLRHAEQKAWLSHPLPLVSHPMQRGSKRHSTAPVVSQAYAGAAVARTATGQFAPALPNAHKRRRTDAPQDADYPGLPVGMTRPSLQVGGVWGGERNSGS